MTNLFMRENYILIIAEVVCDGECDEGDLGRVRPCYEAGRQTHTCSPFIIKFINLICQFLLHLDEKFTLGSKFIIQVRGAWPHLKSLRAWDRSGVLTSRPYISLPELICSH